MNENLPSNLIIKPNLTKYNQVKEGEHYLYDDLILIDEASQTYAKINASYLIKIKWAKVNSIPVFRLK